MGEKSVSGIFYVFARKAYADGERSSTGNARCDFRDSGEDRDQAGHFQLQSTRERI
jgi:hypothetical protein